MKFAFSYLHLYQPLSVSVHQISNPVRVPRVSVRGGRVLYRAVPPPAQAGGTALRGGQAAGQRRRLRTAGEEDVRT